MKADSLTVVGKRIGKERKSLGLTQSELASRIGITMARLANYEDGRGCLRCGIALDICRNLVISEQWLATGKGDKNCYRGVIDELPKELFSKSFLDIYEQEIEPLYERAGYPDSFVPMLRSDDLHPDVWRTACFKMMTDYASNITDTTTLIRYWMALAEKAGRLSIKYSQPPRERLTELNKKLLVLKDGKEEPFSYEKLHDDLSLVGLDTGWIEIAANELKNLGLFETARPIPIETIRQTVLLLIEKMGTEQAAALYRKIHCKDE